MVVVYPGAVLGAGDPKASGQYVRDLIQGRVPGKIFEASTFTWGLTYTPIRVAIEEEVASHSK